MLLMMITNGFIMLKPEMPDYIVVGYALSNCIGLDMNVLWLCLLLLLLSSIFCILNLETNSLQWIYYINPLAWTIKGLTLNELQSPQWNIPAGNTTWGKIALSTFGIPDET